MSSSPMRTFSVELRLAGEVDTPDATTAAPAGNPFIYACSCKVSYIISSSLNYSLIRLAIYFIFLLKTIAFLESPTLVPSVCSKCLFQVFIPSVCSKCLFQVNAPSACYDALMAIFTPSGGPPGPRLLNRPVHRHPANIAFLLCLA